MLATVLDSMVRVSRRVLYTFRLTAQVRKVVFLLALSTQNT